MGYSLSLPCWSIGTECYQEIYHYTKPYGTKVAVIGGHTAMEKAYGPIVEALKDTPMELSEPIWYGGDATYENAEKLEALETIQNCDMIFAIGGGRAVDTSKIVADHLDKPLFTFPTLASNCAGCTSIAITYYENKVYRGIYYPKRCPIHCFINMNIIADSPVSMLWAGIGDSIAKEFESEYAARGHELSHVPHMGVTMAKACTRPLMEYGPKAMDQIREGIAGKELEECALAVIITAGLVSNMTISPDGTEYFYNSSAAHAFYYAATVAPECAECHLHGEIVFFGILVLLTLDGQEENLKMFHEFAYSLGLPVTLRQMDYSTEYLEDSMKKVADGSVAEWGLAPKDHVYTTEEYVQAILEADRRGEAFLMAKEEENN